MTTISSDAAPHRTARTTEAGVRMESEADGGRTTTSPLRRRSDAGLPEVFDSYRFINGVAVTHYRRHVAPNAAQPVLHVKDLLRQLDVPLVRYWALRATLERLSLSGLQSPSRWPDHAQRTRDGRHAVGVQLRVQPGRRAAPRKQLAGYLEARAALALCRLGLNLRPRLGFAPAPHQQSAE